MKRKHAKEPKKLHVRTGDCFIFNSALQLKNCFHRASVTLVQVLNFEYASYCSAEVKPTEIDAKPWRPLRFTEALMSVRVLCRLHLRLASRGLGEDFVRGSCPDVQRRGDWYSTSASRWETVRQAHACKVKT